MSGFLSPYDVDFPTHISSAYVANSAQPRLRGIVCADDIDQRQRKEVIRQLEKVAREAWRDNWDGMKSKAADKDAVDNTRRLIEALPASAFKTIVPETVVDSDGEIALEWFVSAAQLFSVSVGPKGRLAYAGMINGHEVSGRVQFENQIPLIVLENIRRIIASARR